MNSIKTLFKKVYQKYVIHFFNKFKTREQIFSQYYEKNYWGNPESRSGEGSSMNYTQNIRKALPALVEKYNIHTILDTPCGDFNWFKNIEFKTPVTYTGGDIVKSLIDELNETYKSDARSFIYIDITKDPLPKADLLICRDALFHFSYEDIHAFLNNFRKSEIEWLLVTNNTLATKNKDIIPGNWRTLNLRAEPFFLPEPKESILDCPPTEPFQKYMVLWNRKDLLQVKK
jgi:hypothetical protein